MSLLDGLNDSQRRTVTALVGAVVAEGLPRRAAVILVETGLVESGLLIYANSNVPESLQVPHDAIGVDHYSVGPLQQQVPSWGSAADCMDPTLAALKFLHGSGNNPGLLTLPGYRFDLVGYPNAASWEQIPTGSAAQAVQVSAFPDRYQQKEADATALVDELWPAAPDTGNTKPLTDEDTMYELWQIPLRLATPAGTVQPPNAGRVFLIPDSGVAFWASLDDVGAVTRFGKLKNPGDPKSCLQADIDKLNATIRKGIPA